MTSDRWLSTWALGSVALGGASLALPLYFVTVDGRPLLLGLLAGLAAAAGAPGALLVGRLADKTGKRRQYVLWTLVAVAVVLAAVPFTRDGGLVVAASALVWFAAGGVAPVVTLLVTVGHPESRWSERFAVLNVYGGWGWAGGLVLGTVWTALATPLVGVVLAQQVLFVLLAGAAAAAAFLGMDRLPADPGHIDESTAHSVADELASARRVPVRSATLPIAPGRLYWLLRSAHPRELSRRLSPRLLKYFLGLTAVFVGFGIFWGPLPLYLTDLGYASSHVFALYLVSSLGAALFYRRAGGLAAEHDPTTLQSISLFGRAVLHPAVALVGLAAVTTAVGLLLNGLLFALIGVAWAVLAVTAATIVTALAPAELRGEAIGVYTAVSGLATGVGSVVGGWLGAWSFPSAFAVAGGSIFLGAVVVLLVGSHEVATDEGEDVEPQTSP